MRPPISPLLYSLLILGFPSGAQNSNQDIALIGDQALANAEDRPGDWMANGLNQAEDRFSPLKQITKENIGDLGLVWAKKLGTTRGVEATPLIIDEVMYFTLTWSKVMAVDCEPAKPSGPMIRLWTRPFGGIRPVATS